jgi:hypothetical protein
MQLIYFPYAIPFIIAVIVNLFTVGLIWYKRGFPGWKWLILSMLAITIWNFCVMLDVFYADLPGRIFWSKMEYLGANTASPLFLLFFLITHLHGFVFPQFR